MGSAGFTVHLLGFKGQGEDLVIALTLRSGSNPLNLVVQLRLELLQSAEDDVQIRLVVIIFDDFVQGQSQILEEPNGAHTGEGVHGVVAVAVAAVNLGFDIGRNQPLFLVV